MTFLKSFPILVFGMCIASTILMSCSNDDSDDSPVETEGTDDGTTDDGAADDTIYDISNVLELFAGTDLSYEVTGDNVVFTTTDLPNHKSPYWDASHELYEAYNGDNPAFMLNPNRISEQNIVFTIPLKPSAADTNEATPLGPIGISRNGVVFFNQYAGPDQPLTNEIDSFDQYLGHPQNRGTYHYHIEPTFLTGEFGQDAFLGLLSDGFPVYGPTENEETITNDDLNEFHGHTHATEEFPDGIYHYHITDADPYLNGNGFYGTPGNVSQ
ncbi:MAG: YHYH protein [Bacteroidota bacterium]